jgi:hypothetical protein
MQILWVMSMGREVGTITGEMGENKNTALNYRTKK